MLGLYGLMMGIIPPNVAAVQSPPPYDAGLVDENDEHLLDENDEILEE